MKAIQPKPASGDYTSSEYTVTFKAPPHAFFCPLPEGWVGSDHGTVLFLKRPDTCSGAGFPSSGRGFEPRDLPRIEVYYGFYSSDDPAKAEPPCRDLGNVNLVGHRVSLCREDKDGLAVVTAHTVYRGDSASEIQMTLVTSPADAERYLASFKAVLASVHTCRDTWTTYDKKGRKLKSETTGHGPQCPPGQWY